VPRVSSLISKLSPTLSNAINTVQSKVATVQTTLATNVNPDLSAASASAILTLTSDLSTWNTRSTNLKTVKDIVDVAQTGLTSISSLMYQMKTLANLADSLDATSSTYDTELNSLWASYITLANQITNTASSAYINSNSNNLLTSDEITIYPALSSDTNSNIYLTNNYEIIGNAFSGHSWTVGDTDYLSPGDTYDELTTYISKLSADQSALTGYGTLLSSAISNITGIESGINSYISNLQDIDTTALQADLQSYNNQLSIDYYLVGQMNAAASSELAIFH
jgi:flagellin-like hook-associated protein FlgL